MATATTSSVTEGGIANRQAGNERWIVNQSLNLCGKGQNMPTAYRPILVLYLPDTEIPLDFFYL